MVGALFPGKLLNHEIDPDEAVANGAAVLGATLAGSPEAKVLTLPFGIIQIIKSLLSA